MLRTNFQHVRPEDDLVAGREMISVIFHERRATREAARHDFHGADERGGFPIAFASEAVAVGHQALRREAGQLHETVQIFKRCGKPWKPPAVRNARQNRVRCARLRGRNCAGHLLCAGRRRRSKSLRIAPTRLSIFFGVTALTTFPQIADAVAVDGKTKLDLRGYLVAFGHGHFAHVVTETAELRRLQSAQRGGGARPRREFFLRGFSCQKPTTTLRAQTASRLQMKPCSRSPCAPGSCS